ncbi:hypothetical protein [Lactobacillus corticis]|uniref:Uncharacterized protein n=1 Tax=Lactobacillus corticis TaxID=2201249 RepID=A0A916QJ33_9LACO|nr:hypothetical protein [Lactobacillus corticis]GFZ26478.1 hypothetical protein LCB40_03580 [Lactobacillus corticis]
MTKYRIKVDESVSTLLEKYLEKTDQSLDQVANEALKTYLLTKFNSREARRILNDCENSKDYSSLLDRFASNDIDDHY